MAFDAVNLSVIVKELSSTIVGGRITKITQPEKDQIILNIYCNRGGHKLLLSANANVTRIHLTEFDNVNPLIAPAFCMLLRKHLTNATILSVTQMPYERVVDIMVEHKNELGYTNIMHLVFELTGKTSNIILTDNHYIIQDSLKHLPTDLDSKRLLLNGSQYSFFAPQDKIAPNNRQAIIQLITNSATDIRTLLQDNLLGMSNTTVNEILINCDCTSHNIPNASAIADSIDNYLSNIGSCPNIIFHNGNAVEVCAKQYLSIKGEARQYDTLNQAHDYYYYYLDRATRFKNKAKSTNTIVKNAIARTEKKIGIQHQGIIEASTNTTSKIYGDLILSNLHIIKQGDSQANVTNYYDESCPTVVIPLEVNKSPQQNAQLYYKKYQKQKSTIHHNTILLEQNKALLDHLLSIQQGLKNCSESSDLEEVIAELITIGIISKKKNKKPTTTRPAQPYRYLIDGYTIIVGKNNTQNNYVTFQVADKNDIWVHTQSIHSSHTIIITNGTTPPDDVVVKACEITAYYSQARQGSKIAVDYTARYNIKKPSKARLGLVIYNQYNTLIVNPCQHLQYLAN